VLAVAVDVGRAQRVEALRGQRRELGVRAVASVRGVVERVGHRREPAVDIPALAELLAVPVVGDDGRTRVVAAGEDRAGVHSVEVGDAAEIAVDAVAGLDARHRVVAPGEAVVVALGLHRHGLQLTAGGPVEHGHVLRAAENEPLERAQLVAGAAAGSIDVHEVVGQLRGIRLAQRVIVRDLDAERLLEGRRPLAARDLGKLLPAHEHVHHMVVVALAAHTVVVLVRDAGLPVVLGKRDETFGCHSARRVVGGALRSGSRLQQHLALAVAVVVVGEHLRVVRPRADVHAEVDAIEQPAVGLVGVDVDVAGVADLRDVLRVRGIPLHDVLVLAVAVDVTDAHVVGGVGVGVALRRDTVGGLLQREVDVAVRPRSDGGARLPLDAADDRSDRVLRGGGAGRIEQVGAVGHGRDRGSVAVDREVGAGEARLAGAGSLAHEQPPAEEHALARRRRHEPAVELLELRGAGGCGGRVAAAVARTPVARLTGGCGRRTPDDQTDPGRQGGQAQGYPAEQIRH
jgi:hypothetical protein